ncbi:pyridoxal phosphate-dependent aminotransferase [Alloalcanivorax mobilis]|uniref:pyridoxal phosphate-dependent aminotransferase n=1 Tax=Alloalcanivorax mobilis TaxID=2019569 RepID=UPI000C7584DF|nr:pyridoxal phosphate-dependent aminotransferase [Alloalcanivorax mobilis]
MSDINLSDRVQRIKPSPTLAITSKAAELRAQGKDIIGLGAGEPDFDTPDHIKQAAIEAINAGKTKYTPVDGTPCLKKAIIDKFKRDNDLSYEANQILVSCGGKQSFFNMALALLNDGDEAIIPAPYWVSYPDMVKVAGGVPVVLETDVDSRFKITAEQLEQAITPKTRLFVINSPSNPSGMAYTQDELAALGEVLKKHPEIVIATDDMYEHILWTGQPFVNIVNACPELYDRTVVMNGVSKAYSMTGWRIGYVGGPQKLVAAMKKVQSQSTSNPASISQAAAEAALAGDQKCVADMVKAFKERHDYVVDALNKLPGVTCAAGDGTFYAFPDFSQAIADMEGVESCTDLAAQLLETAEVALVPGSAFGAPGCLRLSFAVGMDTLKEAIRRIEQALAK